MYKLCNKSAGYNETRAVTRTSDGACIPFDPANTDYQHYLKWLDGYEEVNGEWVKTSDANTPLPADEPQ